MRRTSEAVSDDFGEHPALAGLDRFLTSGAGDVSGVDGQLPWSSRPEAAALLAELSSPGQGHALRVAYGQP